MGAGGRQIPMLKIRAGIKKSSCLSHFFSKNSKNGVKPGYFNG